MKYAEVNMFVRNKQNAVLEGEVLQDKNQKFSAIKHFHLQRENLSELKLSKGTCQIWQNCHIECLVKVREKLGERDTEREKGETERERDAVHQEKSSLALKNNCMSFCLDNQMHYSENSKMPPNYLLDTKSCLAIVWENTILSKTYVVNVQLIEW